MKDTERFGSISAQKFHPMLIICNTIPWASRRLPPLHCSGGTKAELKGNKMVLLERWFMPYPCEIRYSLCICGFIFRSSQKCVVLNLPWWWLALNIHTQALNYLNYEDISKRTCVPLSWSVYRLRYQQASLWSFIMLQCGVQGQQSFLKTYRVFDPKLNLSFGHFLLFSFTISALEEVI